MENLENLHIVSWNVQHWKATIDNIKKDFGSLENWLEKLKIDILCLQEVGVQVKDINIKYGSEPKGYESFWSWIATPSKAMTGCYYYYYYYYHHHIIIIITSSSPS